MLDFKAAIEEIHRSNLREGFPSHLVYATQRPEQSISTLKNGVYRKLSPQLNSVYEYIESWEEALSSKDILSLNQIEIAWEIAWIRENTASFEK